jgi:broad specificity phosphatase PhoE
MIDKKQFFYMRHAQTDAHAQKLICGGDWDLPLNEQGILQAKVAAKEYRTALASVQRVITSPLIRAKQTGLEFSEQLCKPLVVSNQLREWRLGDWDRQPWDAVPNLFTRLDAPPNGETSQQLDERISSVLTEVSRLSGTSLIVGHGGVWYSLLRILGLEGLHIPSCEPFEFSYSSSGWHINPVRAA